MVTLTEKVYEIRINKPKEGTAPIDEKKKAIGKDTAAKTKTNVEIIGKKAKAAIGVVATVYATSQLVVRPMLNDMMNSAMASGDMVKAQAIQSTYNNVNKVVNLGMEVAGIAAAFMINPVVGGFALLGSVAKHTTEAINRNQNNHFISEMNKVDNFISTHDRNRMINVKVG